MEGGPQKRPAAATATSAASVGPAGSGATLLSLAEEERQRLLSFLANLGTVASLCAACRALQRSGRSPAAWEGAVVSVSPTVVQQHSERLLELGLPHFGLAAEVRLAASRSRRLLEAKLRERHPALSVETDGDGPFMIFAMPVPPDAPFMVGHRTGLHFFEPRYRWMCLRLLAGERCASFAEGRCFGWVTSGRPVAGARGSLCRVLSLEENRGGTFDVSLVSVADFRLVEAWPELARGVPPSAPLTVGYIERMPGGMVIEELEAGVYPVRSDEVNDSDSDEEDEEEGDFAEHVDEVLGRLVSGGDIPLPELSDSGGDEDDEDGEEEEGGEDE